MGLWKKFRSELVRACGTDLGLETCKVNLRTPSNTNERKEITNRMVPRKGRSR